MILPIFIVIVGIALLFTFLGFLARVKWLALPGMIIFLLLGLGLLSNGLQSNSGKNILQVTGDPTYSLTSSYALLAGTNSTSLENVKYFNGAVTNITESNSDPGLDFRVNITTTHFDNLYIRLKAPINNHKVNIQMWDFHSDSWATLDSYTKVDNFTMLKILVPSKDQFLKDNQSRVRLFLDDTGNPADVHYIDWITLETEPATSTIEKSTFDDVSSFDITTLAIFFIVIGAFGSLVVILI